MEEILRSNNLSFLIPKLKEHDLLDLELCRKLSTADLKELIPSLGWRVKFSEAVTKNSIDENQRPIIVTVPPSVSPASTLIADINVDECSTSSSSASPSSYIYVPEVPREVSFIGMENAFTSPILPEFDLKTLLEMTPLGSTILNFYNKNQTLDNTKRSLLVDIIMKKVFNYIVKHRLTHCDYNILSAKIVTLFPSEVVATYYVPAISKKSSSNNKPIISKGRLVDKCRNLLRLNRDILREDKHSFKKRVEEYVDAAIENDKLWLSIRCEPWNEVEEKWRNTYDLRRLTNVDTVHNFFEEWPILKDPRAVNLINIDFELMFPQSSLKIFFKWQAVMDKLIDLKRNSVKDNTSLNYFEVLEHEDCAEDTKTAIHLSLLPYLIPPKGRTKIDSKKHWKFSAAEVLESLLMHVKTPGDIEAAICQYQEKMCTMKQTVQPYILIEGPNIERIRSVYVIVDKIHFKCDSVLKAVDLLFKIFHTVNASYPIQSEYIWYLIEKSIYEINSNPEKVIPYIMNIIELLKNIE